MPEAESLEQSVATALELKQNEISRFVALTRLRKIIEQELAKDLAEDQITTYRTAKQ